MSAKQKASHKPKQKTEAYPSPFLDQAQAASFLRLSTKTLERLRDANSGPPYHKLGLRRIFYVEPDLVSWAEKHKHLPEAG